MKKGNNKGFTLIELLAVIVILSVLLAIAIPAVSKYINSSKKNVYVTNVKEYVKAARQELLINNSKYQLPINHNQATIISFEELKGTLDDGGEFSSYGGAFINNNSFVVVVNNGEAEDPDYIFYVAALDDKGYGIGNIDSGNATAGLIQNTKIESSNIVQLGVENGFSYTETANKLGVEVTKTYGYSSTNTNGND